MERLGLWRTEASRSSNSYICLSFFLHSLLVFSPSPQRSAALHTWLNKAGLWESVWMPARSHAAVKRQAFHPSHFWTEFFAPTFFPPLPFLPNPSLAFPPLCTFPIWALPSRLSQLPNFPLVRLTDSSEKRGDATLLNRPFQEGD